MICSIWTRLGRHPIDSPEMVLPIRPARADTRCMTDTIVARLAGALLAIACLLPFSGATSALAHERRAIGPYTFVVGFIGEPALVGEPNGIDLKITRSDNGEAVLDAEKTLRAKIAFGGGQPKDFPLHARFGVPGGYTADIIPTKAGSYLFSFTGTIGGVSVNEVFESGPGRFSDVEPIEKLQFPDVVLAPASVSASAKRAEDRAIQAEAIATALSERVASSETLAMAGIGAGVLGIATSVAAFVLGRRSGNRPVSQPK